MRKSINLTPFFYLLPALVVIFGLRVYPLIYAIDLSFRGFRLGSPATMYDFVGLKNYMAAFDDWRLMLALKNTIFYTIVAVAVNLVVGLTIALALNRDFRGRGILTTLFYIPVTLSPVVAGYIWKFMYMTPFGIVTYILKSIGLFGFLGIETIHWLSDYPVVLFSIVIVEIWQMTPYVVLILLAALQSMPQDPFDAAKIDGASRWQVFRYITLPLLRPAIAIVLLLRIVGVLRIFEQIMALTAGGPGVLTHSLSTYIYRIGFGQLEVSKATAYGFLTLLIDLPFILTFTRLVFKSTR